MTFSPADLKKATFLREWDGYVFLELNGAKFSMRAVDYWVLIDG